MLNTYQLVIDRKWSFLKDYSKVLDFFNSNIRKKLGDGSKTIFWLDRWSGDSLMKHDFEQSFTCQNKLASVS